MGSGEDYLSRSYGFVLLNKNYLGDKLRRIRRGMWHVWEPGLLNTGLWLRDLKARNNLENLGLDGKIIIIKGIFKKWDV
jgi:hypothetical protein